MLIRSCLKRVGSVLNRIKIECFAQMLMNADGKYIPVILGGLFECAKRRSTGYTETLDDGLRMDLLSDELLCLPEELRSQNANTCCTVTNFVVLNL